MSDATNTVTLTQPCDCGGRLLPEPHTLHLDADGFAMIDTRCPRCGLQGYTDFAWDAPDEWSGDPDSN